MTPQTFKDIEWRTSYKTSSLRPDGRPVDILHDFYIPALRLASRYDRIAGFFRSSSLAIASQGFSAFTAENGRMRLIVGADLHPDDVAAVLKGDRMRLEGKLSQELEGAERWPAEVARGVTLLAWMVAKGFLEVRVAFRVHGSTGRPISMDSTEDGYVHEKWAVFTDRLGNRMYISGSLNESRSALALNAENIDVHCEWWNELEKQRVEEAEKDFETVWKDRSPYLRVMPLPEAVRQKLIRFAEGITNPVEVDGTSGRESEIEPPSALERLKFSLVRHGPTLPGGRFVGMETAPVAPWPHQEVVARRLIETWPFSWLLCDEVGLGKTIEAGLAIRSLVLSGLAKRVLIAAPASLTKQWQREMASKFLLSFGRALSGPGSRHEYIFPHETCRTSTNIYKPGLIIVSTGLLAHKGRKEELESALGFDITLVDEAHYARRKNPTAPDNRRIQPKFGRLYKTLRDRLRPRSKALWLATATPMQLDWIEVYDLIYLTNRVGAFQEDPTLVWGYYEILGRLAGGEDLSKQEWRFLGNVIKSIDYHDPFLKRYLEEAVVDGRIRSAVRQLVQYGRPPKGRDVAGIKRIIFAVAPLSRVMQRHTRPLLEIYKKEGKLRAGLAKRTILPIPRITFTAKEQEVYDKLEEFCSGLAQQIREHSQDRQSQTSLKFLLSLLRLRFASSLYAIEQTLKRRLEKVELSLLFQEKGKSLEIETFTDEVFDEEDADEKIVDSLLKNRSKEDLEWEQGQLKGLIRLLSSIETRPSKIQTLLDILEQRQMPGGRLKQTVIFTRFYDTLCDIVSKLRRINPAMLIGTFSGKGGQYVDPATSKLKNASREEIKHRFLRQEIDVLVCTDAAAEGLNLQTADLLINFDLPWNPMKVEQRIGRIDRIGQKHSEIFVLNLCYVGSVEEVVYGRLLERLNQAGQVVGSQQLSMLPVYDEDFRELAEGKLSPNQLEKRAMERIESLRRQTSAMEIPAEELYEIYMRLAEREPPVALPVTLQGIWSVFTESDYLKALGCEVSQDGKVMTIRGIAGVKNGTLITPDREIFDAGLPGIESPVHFASYGDPVFQAILDQVNSHDMPDCIAAVSVTVPGLDTAVMAFAVKTRSSHNGKLQIRLISSLQEAQGLSLDNVAAVNEADCLKAKKELENRVTEEFMPILAAEGIEMDNIMASEAQRILSLVTGYALLNHLDMPDNEAFWPLVRQLDGMLLDDRDFRQTNLWADPLRPFESRFLFNVQIPILGEYAEIEAPGIMAISAVDSCCRIASLIHKKKAEITIGEVLNKIESVVCQHKSVY